MSQPPVKILFVCLGNICRSPAAEGVFRSLVHARALGDEFEIDSAGILSEHAGEPADGRMRRHARARGYLLDSISRPVQAADFTHFDYLLGMDHQNIRDLLSLAPDREAEAKISLFLAHAPELGTEEVPDPYYGGDAGFERVLDLVEAASEALLNQLHHGF